MKKWLVVLSALVLTGMIWLMPTEYEVQAEEVTTTTVTPGDAGSTSALPTVTSLAWGDNFDATFTVSEEKSYRWYIDLYRDGELYKEQVEKGKDSNLSVTANLAYYVANKDATYSFKVRLQTTDQTEEVASGLSQERAYVYPKKKIDAPVAEWDLTRPGTVVFDAIEGATGYFLRLYSADGASIKSRSMWLTETDTAGQQREVDFSEYIEASGKYYVTVNVRSGNVDELGNNFEDTASKIYNAATGSVEELAKLAAPSNLRWDGWNAKWDAVEGAKSYYVEIYRNGNASKSWGLNVGDNCSLDFMNTEIEFKNGVKNTVLSQLGESDYTFCVQAISNTSSLSSEMSAKSPSQTYSMESTLMQSGTLATPTGLTWGDNYTACFDAVQDTRGYYTLQLYKDNECVFTYTITANNSLKTVTSEMTTYYIDESGTYKYRVRSSNRYNPENLTASEWSEFSEEKVYVRPEKQLGTTVGKWDPERPGVFLWDSIEDTYYYRLHFYKNDDQNAVPGRYGKDADEEAGIQMEYDASKRMTETGKYYFRVKAISSNLDEVANGVLGAPCEVFNTEKTSEEISNVITEAMKNDDAQTALEAIKVSADVESMKLAMQTNDTVLSQMKDLEAKYIAQTGVTAVTNPSKEVKEMMDTSKVSMVGAALNGVAGSKMSLDVTIPEKEVKVDTLKYANSVQVDIKLTDNGASISELEVPITITMPVPNSLVGKDLRTLTIIHYSSIDGSHEALRFKDNGDGTVSFTVTHFSTFVFAMEQNGNDNNANIDDNEDDEEDEEDGDNEVEVAPIRDNVPKTGECLPIALPMAAVAGLVLAAVSFKKREK